MKKVLLFLFIILTQYLSAQVLDSLVIVINDTARLKIRGRTTIVGNAIKNTSATTATNYANSLDKILFSVESGDPALTGVNAQATGGILLPRMNTTMRNTIFSNNAQPDGTLIYDTALHAFYYYNGSIWQSLSSQAGGNLPVGTILAYGVGGTTPPSGYLFCDGSSISKNTYPDLYAAIGTTFGGNGNPNFNLPDLRGMFLRGRNDFGNSTGARSDGNQDPSGSRALGNIQLDNLKEHRHFAVSDHLDAVDDGTGYLESHNSTDLFRRVGPISSRGYENNDYSYVLKVNEKEPNRGITGVPLYASNYSLGSDGYVPTNTTFAEEKSVETRPRNMAVNYIIKVTSTSSFSTSNLLTDTISALNQTAKKVYVNDTLATTASRSMVFNTNGSERMRINLSGNIGIGTKTPSERLTVSAGGFTLNDGASSPNGFIFHPRNASSYDFFQLAPVTNGTVDWAKGIAMNRSTGNVGIGTTSPSTQFEIKSASGLDAVARLTEGTSSNFFDLKVQQSSGIFYINNGLDRFIIHKNGNVGIGAVPSYPLHLYTSAATSLYIESTTQDNNGMLILNANTSSNWSTNWHEFIYFQKQGVNIGAIVSDGGGGSAVKYSTSSDYRLKENISSLPEGLSRVLKLKPSIYTWKINGEKHEGFIAHELQEIFPYAVTGKKDEVDKDGKPKYQGVDYGKITPLLTKAIQEQQVMIEEQRKEIAELKAQIQEILKKIK